MSSVEPQCPVLPGGEPCESPRWTLAAEAEWMGRVCDDCAAGHVRFNLIAARGLRVVDRAVVDEATGHVLAVFPATEGLALARAFLLSAPDEMLRTHRSRWREVAESEAGDGLGVAPCSPVPPSAAEGLRDAQRGAERVSDADAAEWGRLATGATGGPWRSGFYGDRDEWELSAEFVIVSYREPDTLSDADAAFIAAARTAVPRLLAEREALRAEVDRLSGLRLVDSVAAQAEEVASLTVERDRALGTIRIMLGDAAAEGRCGCAALYDGPQEDCPLHGRDYAWWVGTANQAYADLERLRGECRAVHPTNSTVVPCCLAAGHPEETTRERRPRMPPRLHPSTPTPGSLPGQ